MPSSRGKSVLFVAAPLLMLLGACHGGGGSTDDPDVPLSNVDLAVTSFTVSPTAADPEDVLTLSGTIQNVGTETANPDLGDSFLIGFNLSTDGTFELNEQGFLQKTITAPIPAGESLDFTYTSSYGLGDTLYHHPIFCSGDLGGECEPPETGVIGVKADFANGIAERNEGDNFQFQPIEVVGTLVASTFGGCDSNGGCDLRVSDGTNQVLLHWPFEGDGTEILFPNELQRYVTVSLTIINCLDAQHSGGTCGGGWYVNAVTAKPGFPVSTKTLYLTCTAQYEVPPSLTETCSRWFEIRDPDY